MKKKYDIGILGVHGIGHQKEGDTYKNIVYPIIDDLKNTWEEDRTRYEIKDRNNSAEVRKGSERLIFEEVTWTPNYHKLPKNHIFWILQNISVLALIWGIYRYKNTGEKNKFNYKNIIVSALLYLSVLVLIPAMVKIFIESIALFYVLIILAIILIFPAILYLSSLSPTRVVHGAVNNSNEIKDSIYKIKKKIYMMLEECEEVIIAAHSQGGYMVYKALADIGHENKNSLKHISFYGIGSGIIPILLMQKLKISKFFISLSFLVVIIGGSITLILWIIVALERFNLIKRFDTNISILVPVIASIITIFTFIIYYLLGKSRIKDFQIADDALNTIKIWEEYSAPEDMVGRSNLLFQKNSKIKSYMIPSAGYFILTHIKYFSNVSIVPKIFSMAIVGQIYSQHIETQEKLSLLKDHILTWSEMVVKDKSANHILVTMFGSIVTIFSLAYKNIYSDDFWLIFLAIPFVASLMFFGSLFLYPKGPRLEDIKRTFLYLSKNKKYIYLLISVQITAISSIILIAEFVFITNKMYTEKFFILIYILASIFLILYVSSIGLPAWGNIRLKILSGFFTVISFLFFLGFYWSILTSVIMLIDIIYTFRVHYYLLDKTLNGTTIREYRKYIRNTYNNKSKNQFRKAISSLLRVCMDIYKYYINK